MSETINPEPRTLRAPFFVRGELVEGDAVRHTSRDLGADFVTPALDLDKVITPRSELPPRRPPWGSSSTGSARPLS